MAGQLLNKLAQVKVFIKKHNPTIGLLTEEIIRDFLKEHLPKSVSVEQGFIINSEGEVSKQCDILIYDSLSYSPLYRIKDVVIIPSESVIAVIEVKTTINKKIFHDTIKYFREISRITSATTYLFIYNSQDVETIDGYFHSYKHEGDYQKFDHDTFYYLPDQITGLSSSYHLKKDFLPYSGSDYFGYSSWVYEGIEGTEINALQNFYESVSKLVYSCISNSEKSKKADSQKQKRKLKYIKCIELFLM